MNTFTDLIKRRITCRNFSDQTLSRQQLQNLIHAAVWVPSGSNNQPWRFVVITDRVRLQHYSDAAKAAWLADLDAAPYMRQYETFMKDPAYNIFYNAPALIIVYGDTNSYWHVYDCSMVAYNLHLLAEDQGLGCCWIGFGHNIFADPQVKSELGVPRHYQLVAPVILGHPAIPAEHRNNPNQRKPFEILWI